MFSNCKRIVAATAAAAVALSTAIVTPADARSRGDAAALAAIVGVFGTIAAIAAADAARDRYDGPYYGAPYYGPGPYYGVPHPAPYWRHGRRSPWHR